VNHGILLKLVGKKIKCDKTMELMGKIIKSDNAPSGKGIPIGNLTSQLFANIYLNELDCFIKRNLRARYYIRYMDDFLILDFSKKKLHQAKEEIRRFLENNLRLKLHPKKANVCPADKGIDFLGYVVFENYRLLRKSTIKRFIKRTKKYAKKVEQNQLTKDKFAQSVASWTAYAGFGNSWRLRRKLGRKGGLI